MMARMDGLPWHPSVVHFPLVLGLLVPLLGAILFWFTRSDDTLAQKAFRLPLAAQAFALITAIVAQRTGDGDHERVEDFVDTALLHGHEEAGELFTIATGVVFAIWFASALAREAKVARSAALVAVAAGIVAAVLGMRAGHLGGELVYIHGAADAWKAAPTDSVTP